MSSEWKDVRLGDLTELVTKGTTPTSLGYSFTDSGINYVKSESVTFDGFIDCSKFAFIDSTTHTALKRSQLKEGDILFSMAGIYIGKTAVVPKQILPANTNQAVGIIRLNITLAWPRFIDYYIRNPSYNLFLNNLVSQSAQPNLNLAEIKNLPIKLPPINEQKKIANTLGVLDDRITLLRETNTTLEAIAQALFKSWFVDFDPVRAKMEGRETEGMDAETAALFPDSFEESELGLIPKGWHICPISEMVEGIYDGPHATPPEADEGPIFLGIKNLTGTGLNLSEIRHIHEDQWAQWTRRVTPRLGDIVFSYEATLGFFALIPPDMCSCLGRRLALVRPFADRGCGHFWFHQFISRPFQRLLKKHTIQGATVDRIALKQFPSYTVLAPTQAIRLTFDQAVAPLWAKIHANQAQAQNLTNLRDTLLPRLISGQLRLPDAEAILQTHQ